MSAKWSTNFASPFATLVSVTLLLCTAACDASLTPPTAPNAGLNADLSFIVDSINVARVATGSARVVVNTRLVAAAQIGSDQMAAADTALSELPAAKYPSVSDWERAVGYMSESRLEDHIAGNGSLTGAAAIRTLLAEGRQSLYVSALWVETGVAQSVSRTGKRYYVIMLARPRR